MTQQERKWPPRLHIEADLMHDIEVGFMPSITENSTDTSTEYVSKEEAEHLAKEMVREAVANVFSDLIKKAKPHFGSTTNDAGDDLRHESQVNFWKWLRKEASAAAGVSREGKA